MWYSAVALSTVEEHRLLLGTARVARLQAVCPDVWIRPCRLAVVVSASSRAKVDMVARELHAALAAGRSRSRERELRAAIAAAHCRAASDASEQEWQELRQALLAADAARHVELR